MNHSTLCLTVYFELSSCMLSSVPLNLPDLFYCMLFTHICLPFIFDLSEKKIKICTSWLVFQFGYRAQGFLHYYSLWSFTNKGFLPFFNKGQICGMHN